MYLGGRHAGHSTILNNTLMPYNIFYPFVSQYIAMTNVSAYIIDDIDVQIRFMGGHMPIHVAVHHNIALKPKDVRVDNGHHIVHKLCIV